MEDLTPRVIAMNDSAQFQPGGRTRETTVVQYMVGRFGPFEHIFDRNPTRIDLDRVMADRRATLEGLAG